MSAQFQKIDVAAAPAEPDGLPGAPPSDSM